MKDATNILSKLWEIKEKENLSDKELEAELGIDRMTIWRWRKMKNKPSVLAIKRIEEFIRKETSPLQTSTLESTDT